MNIEYEVRVLEINHNEMVKRIEKLGGELKFSNLQKRFVYDFKPAINGKWIRLRTNGIKNTLTIKNILAKTVDGTQELEIEVNDFDKMNQILNELGYKSRSYQENKRTQYVLDGVEIDLDQWPMIPEYMEIEGHNEQEINNIIKKLKIQDKKIVTLDVESIYKEYGIDVHKIENLHFKKEEKNEKI